MGTRLLFLGPGFSEVGGAQNRARILARGLADKGWDVRAVNRAGTARKFKFMSENRLRSIDVPGFTARWLGALTYLLVGLCLGLYWGAKSSVMVAMQVGSQTMVAAICGALLRKPFVVLSTSSGLLSELKILRQGRLSGLRRWAISRATLVVVQTADAATELGDIVDSSRVRVMPNPVQSQGPWPLNGRPHVLFMGRLSEEKDLLNLLRAWSDIVAERPEATLTLLGEGGHFRSVESEIRRLVESDETLAKSVKLPGWSDDPASFLREADVFVFPSLSEGMSNSLLEACAAGRVVVASAISSNVAVLGDGYPFLFPPGNYAQLRSALNEAFDDPEKRQRALEAIDSRMGLFSVTRILGLFERMLLDAQDRARDLHT